MVVQDDGTVVPKQVEIGALEDNGMRVITRGLLPTDRVVINGLMRLRHSGRILVNLTLAIQINGTGQRHPRPVPLSEYSKCFPNLVLLSRRRKKVGIEKGMSKPFR